MAHPLDNVVWSALSGSNQIAISDGSDSGRRYKPSYAPFGGVPDHSKPVWDNFVHFIQEDPSFAAAFFAPQFYDPPAPLGVFMKGTGFQMMAPDILPTVDPKIALIIVTLTEADAPEMRALAHETKPGPFLPRTHELGTYYGIRVDGRLVAMAGERMRPVGFSEISAVCTKATSRGKGYAAALVLTVAHNIAKRADKPFLHVAEENVNAIALYKKLGFTMRSPMSITVIGKRLPEGETVDKDELLKKLMERK